MSSSHDFECTKIHGSTHPLTIGAASDLATVISELSDIEFL
jgi:hypothetical protein